jgi:hypothetical protein
MCTEAKQLLGWTLGLIAKQQFGNSNKFVAAVLQKGGAEGWVQVELTERYETLPNVAWVQREQHIFNGAFDKVDFLIKCNGGSETCVELKVESLFASADQGRSTMPHTHWQSVNGDVEKLRDDRNPTYSGQPAFAVAIVWSTEAINGMNGWLPMSGLTFECEQYLATHGGSGWPVTVYVITVT